MTSVGFTKCRGHCSYLLYVLGAQCGNTPGQMLFNESSTPAIVYSLVLILMHSSEDWYMLYGLLSLLDIRILGFKSNLMRNMVEGPAIKAYFDSKSFSLPVFLCELFNGAVDRGVTGASRDDWLCMGCIKSIIEPETMNWWLDRNRAGGCFAPLVCNEPF